MNEAEMNDKILTAFKTEKLMSQQYYMMEVMFRENNVRGGKREY